MDLREEPGKQKPRSCRAQELARSRAQENAWKKKVKWGTQWNRREEKFHVNSCGLRMFQEASFWELVNCF